MKYIDVCQIEDIPTGEAKMFVIDELAISLFHIDGGFYALENACPHAGASLAMGRIEGSTVACRIHHWNFDIPSGRYLGEEKPCHNVKSMPVRVVGTRLEVGVD